MIPRTKQKKNGTTALWTNTGVVKFKYYVSQKHYSFNKKIKLYSTLLTCIFKLSSRPALTKICVLSNFSNCGYSNLKY